MKSPKLFALSVFAAPLIVGGAVRFSDPARRELDSGFVHDTISCLDTLHASDSVNAVVKMSVKPQEPKTKLPPDFEDSSCRNFDRG